VSSKTLSTLIIRCTEKSGMWRKFQKITKS
jgi:hypothetical protein